MGSRSQEPADLNFDSLESTFLHNDQVPKSPRIKNLLPFECIKQKKDRPSGPFLKHRAGKPICAVAPRKCSVVHWHCPGDQRDGERTDCVPGSIGNGEESGKPEAHTEIVPNGRLTARRSKIIVGGAANASENAGGSP